MARSLLGGVTHVTHLPLSAVCFAGCARTGTHTHTVYMAGCVTSVTEPHIGPPPVPHAARGHAPQRVVETALARGWRVERAADGRLHLGHPNGARIDFGWVAER
jgi:hypothetical protein